MAKIPVNEKKVILSKLVKDRNFDFENLDSFDLRVRQNFFELLFVENQNYQHISEVKKKIYALEQKIEEKTVQRPK